MSKNMKAVHLSAWWTNSMQNGSNMETKSKKLGLILEVIKLSLLSMLALFLLPNSIFTYIINPGPKIVELWYKMSWGQSRGVVGSPGSFQFIF